MKCIWEEQRPSWTSRGITQTWKPPLTLAQPRGRPAWGILSASWGMHCHLAALGGSIQPGSLGSSAQASEIPGPQVLCGPLGPYSAGRATANQCLRVWTGMSLWSGPSLCETVLRHSCIAWHSGRKNAPSQRSDLSCWNDRKKGNTSVVSWCRDAAPLCLSGVMGPTKHQPNAFGVWKWHKEETVWVFEVTILKKKKNEDGISHAEILLLENSHPQCLAPIKNVLENKIAGDKCS